MGSDLLVKRLNNAYVISNDNLNTAGFKNCETHYATLRCSIQQTLDDLETLDFFFQPLLK